MLTCGVPLRCVPFRSGGSCPGLSRPVSRCPGHFFLKKTLRFQLFPAGGSILPSMRSSGSVSRCPGHFFLKKTLRSQLFPAGGSILPSMRSSGSMSRCPGHFFLKKFTWYAIIGMSSLFPDHVLMMSLWCPDQPLMVSPLCPDGVSMVSRSRWFLMVSALDGS